MQIVLAAIGLLSIAVLCYLVAVLIGGDRQ